MSKYIREINLFFRYQKAVGLPRSLPANVAHLALYLSHLLDKKKVSAVSMAHAALKWIHGILPLASNPLDFGLCKDLVEAEKRSRLEPIKKRRNRFR